VGQDGAVGQNAVGIDDDGRVLRRVVHRLAAEADEVEEGGQVIGGSGFGVQGDCLAEREDFVVSFVFGGVGGAGAGDGRWDGDCALLFFPLLFFFLLGGMLSRSTTSTYLSGRL
jgi:hypothetical protein